MSQAITRSRSRGGIRRTSWLSSLRLASRPPKLDILDREAFSRCAEGSPTVVRPLLADAFALERVAAELRRWVPLSMEVASLPAVPAADLRVVAELWRL